MGGLVSDTIGGFNRMLAKQKKERGACRVSTVLFDDTAEVLHNREAIRDVKPITEREYFVRGCTAYYDALGRAISHHVAVQRHAAPDERADKVVFVVITDGMENSSREYSAAKLKSMIELEQTKYGWEFIFMGANMDAVKAADAIGIKAECTVDFIADSKGVAENFDGVSAALSNVRAGCAMEAPSSEDGSTWRTRIDRDYSTRKRK